MTADQKIADNIDPYLHLDEDFPLEGWAWEFLRRRSDYIDAYHVCKLNKQHASKNQEIVGYYPDKEKSETFTDWAIRSEEEGCVGRELTASQMQALDWQLWDMYDPQKPYSRKIHFIRHRPPRYPLAIETQEDIKRVIKIDEFAEHCHVNAVSSKQGVLAFNLENGIEEQLEKAKKVLLKKKHEHKKSEGKRKRIPKWRDYIKTLDAYSKNPTISKVELGQILGNRGGFGDDEEIKNQYSKAGSKNLYSAIRMQEHYRELLTEMYSE